MQKFYTASKACLRLIAVVFFIFSFDVAAQETLPVSQKLWQGITANDLQNIKQITLSINHNDYAEALQYAQKLKKTEAQLVVKERSRIIKIRPDFSEAATDIILWNKYF